MQDSRWGRLVLCRRLGWGFNRRPRAVIPDCRQPETQSGRRGRGGEMNNLGKKCAQINRLKVSKVLVIYLAFLGTVCCLVFFMFLQNFWSNVQMILLHPDVSSSYDGWYFHVSYSVTFLRCFSSWGLSGVAWFLKSKCRCSLPHQDNAPSHEHTCKEPVTQLRGWVDYRAQTRGPRSQWGPPKPGPLFEMTVINIFPWKASIVQLHSPYLYVLSNNLYKIEMQEWNAAYTTSFNFFLMLQWKKKKCFKKKNKVFFSQRVQSIK